MAEHVLLMPDPLGQSGHAKDGRRGQVQGDCIRVRWQVRGTAPVPSHAGWKSMDLLYTEFPPHVFSDWPSYFTLRAPSWIHKGF